MKKPLLVLLLASCATPAPPKLLTADQVSAAVIVKRDDFSKLTTFDAPLGGNDEFAGNGARWFLRAVQSEEQPDLSRYALLFKRHCPAWCHYESALTSDGKHLSIQQTDTDVEVRGPYTICRESYVVDLTREDLERAAKEGMRIKIAGRRGDWIVGFPPYYAEGFLARVDGAQPAGPAK